MGGAQGAQIHLTDVRYEHYMVDSYPPNTKYHIRLNGGFVQANSGCSFYADKGASNGACGLLMDAGGTFFQNGNMNIQGACSDVARAESGGIYQKGFDSQRIFTLLPGRPPDVVGMPTQTESFKLMAVAPTFSLVTWMGLKAVKTPIYKKRIF